MQGWRTHMEDAHICEDVNDDDGLYVGSIFVVFDGHGGDEVAKYAAFNFMRIFKNQETFKK